MNDIRRRADLFQNLSRITTKFRIFNILLKSWFMWFITYLDKMKIPGLVAIISGGAKGLGKATAELFARQSAKIMLIDMNKQEGEELAHAHENMEFM